MINSSPRHIAGFIILMLLNFELKAQTNPAPQIIPYSFTTQTGFALPAGMALHKFGAVPTTRTVSPGIADLPYISGSTSGR